MCSTSPTAPDTVKVAYHRERLVYILDVDSDFLPYVEGGNNLIVKIGYFIKNIGVSGGVKIVLQHVKMLRDAGYDATLFTQQIKDPWDRMDIPMHICKDDLSDLPECDIIIGSIYNDVKKLFQRNKGNVVHLCQGYEPIDYMSRITQESITERYHRTGFFSFVERYFDTVKFKKRIREIEAIYALPTYKAAVSKHLVQLISERYHQKCVLIQNGIDLSVFHPPAKREWGKDGKIRILSMGSMNVGFKGIPDTLEAVKELQRKGVNVELVRVSPGPQSKAEEQSGVVKEYYHGLKEHEMADMYRGADVYISSSLEGEGFGLPAIEALASGLPSILTEVSTYLNFDDTHDYAYFVPVHNPAKIAEGVLAFIQNASFRTVCMERGLRLAREYSLEKTKQYLVAFIESLGNARG
jgi:glycosyltransferase involved in cell wall biosynthesis